MASAIKRRGGTSTAHDSFTGTDREWTHDSTRKTVRVHDGVRAGGYPLARQFELNVQEMGAVGDGATNDTVAIQAAITLALNGGPRVYIPKGTYAISGVTVRGSNVAIRGDGATQTILKRITGSASNNVLELGDTANGNSSAEYSKITVEGLTVDGNKAGVAQPSSDLTDWGIPMTKISNSTIKGVRALNCWNGGIGVFINSNYNFLDCYVENCGVGNTYGGGTTEPGFDVNSSKYNRINVVSKDCQDGFRLLDNCWGNICDVVVQNATVTGGIFGNQSVNNSSGNIVTITVTGGCSGQGVSLSTNFNNSVFNITVKGVTGIGVNDVSNGTYRSEGNTFNVNTHRCGAQGSVIGNQRNVWNITSVDDGANGPAGNYYAVDVAATASGNVISATIRDTLKLEDGTARAALVNGMALRAGATLNKVIGFCASGALTNFDEATPNDNMWVDRNVVWTATIEADWGNAFGGSKPTVSYTKDGTGRVSLRGNAARTSGATTVFMKLPAGYRPAAEMDFSTWSNSAVATVTVKTNGDVELSGGSHLSILLAGISFYTA